MNTLFDTVHRHASERPDAIALRDEIGSLSYARLDSEIRLLAEALPGHRVGILLDNGIHWACLDLALLRRQSACVPMPTFFTDRQLRHLVRDSGLDCIYTDRPDRLAEIAETTHLACLSIAGHRLHAFRIEYSTVAEGRTQGTAKITYTSGTTGEPKGVCLSAEAIQSVTTSLCLAVQADISDRSLSLLPLSTLLENIAGLYAPLQAGAQANIPALGDGAEQSPSSAWGERLFATLNRVAPTTTVLVPQLLKVLLSGIAAGMDAPGSLRFIAVGGAPVSEAMLQTARLFGLPVFQGYGLSEACSVACLNLPGQERDGSVGRTLPHARIRIAEDGEVMVGGTLFEGYLAASDAPQGMEWPSGDLGHLDEDGYLFLTGRKKTVYATSYGRNVAPEWIEGLLTGHPALAQAAVFGEARPFNVAILHGRPGVTARDMNRAVADVNADLPDYARIGGWIQADQPFTPANGLANPSGGPLRDAITREYRARIDHFYEAPHALL